MTDYSKISKSNIQISNGKVLDNVIGRRNVIETLKVSIAAAQMRGEALGHVLLIGPESSGKTTIAHAIVHELDVNVKTATANEIHNQSDLVTALTNLCDGDVLIVEDFNEMRPDCMELLCKAMSDFYLDIVIGRGSSVRGVRLDLPRFTLIGMADQKPRLSERIKDCFYLSFVLNNYEKDELIRLSIKWCGLNKVKINDDAAEKIALYASGSNRKLTFTLKRARDFAQVMNNGVINSEIAVKTINSLSENVFLKDN